MQTRIPLFGFVISALIGCANTGSVVERRPLGSPLGGYKSVAVIVAHADPSAKNAAKHVSSCKTALETTLNASRVFGDVRGESGQEGADVVMKWTIRGVKESLDLQLVGNAGAARVELAMELVDPKSGPIAELDVEGTSEKNTRSSINGIDTDALEDTVKIACENAGKHAYEYLAAHK